MKTIKLNQQSLTFLSILMLVLVGCNNPILSGAVGKINPSPTPAGAGLHFLLTADKIPVTVTHNNTPKSLAKGQTVPISVSDKIAIGDGGIGKLVYSGRVVVEIWPGTEVVMGDVTTVAGDRIEVSLIQDFGTTHITVGENAKAGVILKTNDSTITSLTDGTEFSVCYAPGKDGLTCHPVLRGSIQVFGKTGKSVVYNAPPPVGAYTFNGKAPEAPVCFHDQEYKDWLTKIRNGEKVEVLGAMVDKWYHEPCPDGSAAQMSTASPTPEAMETATPMVMESPTPMVMESPTPMVMESPTPMAMGSATETPAYFTENFTANTDLSKWTSFQWNNQADGNYQPQPVKPIIQNGYLRFDIQKPNLSTYVTYSPSSYGDVKITLSTHNSGENASSVSLVCHANDEGWNEFRIGNNGLYSILGYMVVEKKYYTLFSGGSNAIHTGMGVNEYSATCTGNKLSLSINGKDVNTVKDNMHNFGEGKVGIASSSTDVFPVLNEIDWFKVEKP